MKKRLLAILMIGFMLVGCSSQPAADANNIGTGDEVKTEQPSVSNEEPTEPPHEHAYTEAITTEATCEADGVKTFTCECGNTYTEAIPAMGHVFEEVADSGVSATCAADGKEADTKCSVCESLVEGAVIPATGHSFGEYAYNNDATTKADGTETATCSVCGEKTSRTKEGTKLLYDGYDEFGNGFIYGASTENDRMGNPVRQKLFEANNPYPLYQVVDGGGTNIYYYFIFTGSANKGPEYNACYDAGIAILFSRYPEKTVQMAQGEYVGTYNGQVIYKALPITGSMGPDGRPVW